MRKRSPGSLAILGWLFAIGWILVSTGSVGLLFAQLRPPNESGVSIGHVHLTVRSEVLRHTRNYGLTCSVPR